MNPLSIVLILNKQLYNYLYINYKHVLTSGIPEPQAYGANILTKDADRAANNNAHNI